MSESSSKQVSGIILWIRQWGAAVLAIYAIWTLYVADAQTDGYLWMYATLFWVGVTVFFLGWQGHSHKTLLLLAGAWFGVMVSVLITVFALAMVIGGTTGGDQASQMAALVPILLALYFVPKMTTVWPDAKPLQSVTHHALRAFFCLIQFACALVLMATLSIVKPGDFQKKDAPAAEQSNITISSPFAPI